MATDAPDAVDWNQPPSPPDRAWAILERMAAIDWNHWHAGRDCLRRSAARRAWSLRAQEANPRPPGSKPAGAARNASEIARGPLSEPHGAGVGPVQQPEVGAVVAAGGLYRHYERMAAWGTKRRHPRARLQCAIGAWRGSHQGRRVGGERRCTTAPLVASRSDRRPGIAGYLLLPIYLGSKAPSPTSTSSRDGVVLRRYGVSRRSSRACGRTSGTG